MKETIIEVLKEVERIMKPYKVWLVGGAVRNFLLGKEIKDYDFCTDAPVDKIEKYIKSKSMRPYLTGKRFGTIGVKIKINGKYQLVEITSFRKESYEPNNRKPVVEFIKDLHEDLSRRDFTINSMCISGQRLIKLIKWKEKKNAKRNI